MQYAVQRLQYVKVCEDTKIKFYENLILLFDIGLNS